MSRRQDAQAWWLLNRSSRRRRALSIRSILGDLLIAEYDARFGITLRATRPSGSETYALSDGETLIQAGEIATFNTADFSNIALATAAEVVAVINTDWTTNSATDTTGDFTVTGSSVISGTARVALGISANPFVSAWADLSGNGNDIVQSVPGDQPFFIALGGPNGVPFVEFDGVSMVLDGDAIVAGQPNMIWAVLLPSVGGGAGVRFTEATVVNRRSMWTNATDTNIHAGLTLTEAGGAVQTVFHKIRALFNGASSELQVDADAEATGDALTGAGAVGVSLGGGGGFFADSRITRFFITNADVPAADQLQVEALLDADYGLL